MVKQKKGKTKVTYGKTKKKRILFFMIVKIE
jgi:hypothetical protein